MEVRFQDVTKSYGSTVAVKSLNLSVTQGALHFLLGPSGCGKTTTLRMLAGLETVTSGKIFFDDEDVTTLSASGRGLGMVFQNYALWPHMTVQQNIEYGLKIRKLTKKDIQERMDECLAITRLTPFIKRLPGQLSGGQQQRVALARALAVRPRVLLLDEPLSNLDTKLRYEMRENIVRIHEETRITTVYVTHDQKEALSMGTHITVMQAGSLLQTGTPRQLYQDPTSPFLAGFIGETNLIEGVLIAKEGELFVVETPLGKLTSRKPSGTFQIGDYVVLSIRPEVVTVDDKGLGERFQLGHDNVLEAKLSQFTYLGDTEQLALGFTDTTRLKVNLFNHRNHDFKIDQRIRCFIDPDDVSLLHPDRHLGQAT